MYRTSPFSESRAILLAYATPNEEYYSVPTVPTVSNCEVLTGGTGGTPVHSTTIGLFFRVRGWIAELSTCSDTKRIYEGRYGYNFILCRNQYILTAGPSDPPSLLTDDVKLTPRAELSTDLHRQRPNISSNDRLD